MKGDVRDVYVWEVVEVKGVECGWGDGAVRWTGADVCVCMCLWCVCAWGVLCAGEGCKVCLYVVCMCL